MKNNKIIIGIIVIIAILGIMGYNKLFNVVTVEVYVDNKIEKVLHDTPRDFNTFEEMAGSLQDKGFEFKDGKFTIVAGHEIKGKYTISVNNKKVTDVTSYKIEKKDDIKFMIDDKK